MQLERTLPRIPRNDDDEDCAAMASADVPKEDLRVVRLSQPNVLLIGSQAETAALLPELLACCRQPVHEIDGANDDPRPNAGTLLFRNITALSKEEQETLSDWLECRAGVQVVSVADEPLYPLVAEGAFSAGLFYRLNVVTLAAHGIQD